MTNDPRFCYPFPCINLYSKSNVREVVMIYRLPMWINSQYSRNAYTVTYFTNHLHILHNMKSNNKTTIRVHIYMYILFLQHLLCLVLQALACIAMTPTYHQALSDADVPDTLMQLLLPSDEWYYTNHTTKWVVLIGYQAVPIYVMLRYLLYLLTIMKKAPSCNFTATE